jgi:hypothetical protein
MQLGYLALPFYIATVIYMFSIGMFWYFFRNTRMPEEAPECERQVAIKES